MDKVLMIQLQKFVDLEDIAIQELFKEVRANVADDQWRIESNPEEQWCNIEIRSTDPMRIWKKLLAGLRSTKPETVENLRSRWIVVCEGDDSWNDYKTLAHFDPKVELDDL